MKPKYKKGDTVIIICDETLNFLTTISSRKINETYIVDIIYCGTSQEKNRYKLTGLWFNEDEIAKVTPENDPELFL